MRGVPVGSRRVARTIISIAAAPGWAARFVEEEDTKVVTLLAWALVEDGASRNLVGFLQRPTTTEGPGWVVLADEVDGFDGYTPGALHTSPTG
jgi:hypothetical protein